MDDETITYISHVSDDEDTLSQASDSSDSRDEPSPDSIELDMGRLRELLKIPLQKRIGIDEFEYDKETGRHTFYLSEISRQHLVWNMTLHIPICYVTFLRKDDAYFNMNIREADDETCSIVALWLQECASKYRIVKRTRILKEELQSRYTLNGQ